MKLTKKFVLFVLVLSFLFVPASAFALRDLLKEFASAIQRKDISKIQDLLDESLYLDDAVKLTYAH